MNRVQCFWSAPAPFADESLRRYSSGPAQCTAGRSCHDASVPLGEVSLPVGETGWGRDDVDHADPRWPLKCDACSYVFVADDAWQHNLDRKYADARDSSRRFTLRDPLPGAMFDATWLASCWHGEDGISLEVVLPNKRIWSVDARANNCTLPNDDVHHCWVRHGDPRTQPVTVDKGGVTCAAGAGSIQAGDYHGFLRNGWLEGC